MKSFIGLVAIVCAVLVLNVTQVQAKGHGNGRAKAFVGKVLHPFQGLKDRRAERKDSRAGAGSCNAPAAVVVLPPPVVMRAPVAGDCASGSCAAPARRGLFRRR